MKKILLLLIIVLCSSVIFADNAINNKDVSQAKLLEDTFVLPNDTTVATVNGIAITKEMVMKELWKGGATSVVDALILNKVVIEGLKKENITITEEETKKEIDNIIKQNKLNSLEDLLVGSNLNYDELAEGINIQIGIQKYVEKNFTLDSKKLEGFMKVSHILVMFDSKIENEIEREAACKKKIDEIYAKVKAGEDFAKLAKEYSEDGSKEDGGSLGWVDANVNFVPEFKTAMMKLKAGEYSEPVKSQFGYHIIKMDQRGDTADKKDIEPLVKKEMQKQRNNILSKWLNDLRKEFNVTNYLVPVVTKTEPAPTEETKPAEEKK